jgi:hypothetical protein
MVWVVTICKSIRSAFEVAMFVGIQERVDLKIAHGCGRHSEPFAFRQTPHFSRGRRSRGARNLVAEWPQGSNILIPIGPSLRSLRNLGVLCG